MKKIDWTNQEFNGCIILEPVESIKDSNNDQWKVKCCCGRIFKTRPSSLKNGNTKSCGCLRNLETSKRNTLLYKKYNYYNYINKFGVKLLKPVDPLKEGCRDNWIALCPYHDPPLEFITYPNQVIQNKIKSCSCLVSKKSSENMDNYLKKQRIEKGLNDDVLLTNISDLSRKYIFKLIQPLILKIDNYTCNRCLKQKKYLQVHHIIPIKQFINYSDISTFKQLYDYNNLITLCKECHDEAHNYSPHDINIKIQQKLQLIVSKRLISKDLIEEYNKIVNIEIEPWIKLKLFKESK